MSYILEALKKSERERKLGQVPNLATPQETAPEVPSGATRSWLVPVLLINSVLLLGLLIYLVLWPSAPGLSPLLEREAATEETVAGPAQSTPPLDTAGGETTPQVTDLPSPEATSTEVAPEPIAPQPTLTGEATSAEPLKPPGVETEPATVLPPQPTGPAPKFSELPADVRRQIIAPNLEVHVYSESPARRFVMIGGRQYQEGDRLPGGSRLEEITHQGVELSHHGQHFRLDR